MPKYKKGPGKERQLLVQKEVRVAMDGAKTSKMAGMRQQGTWMK